MTSEPTAGTEGGDGPGEDTEPATEERQSGESATEERQEGNEDEEALPPRYHPPPQDTFDWRGWVLVGIVILSFLVVPGAILYLPHAQGIIAAVGISWRQAYLALPMIPAILLGATAIWAAVRSRSNSD